MLSSTVDLAASISAPGGLDGWTAWEPTKRRRIAASTDCAPLAADPTGIRAELSIKLVFKHWVRILSLPGALEGWALLKRPEAIVPPSPENLDWILQPRHLKQHHLVAVGEF